MDTAFIELRAAEVSIAAACALTGRVAGHPLPAGRPDRGEAGATARAAATAPAATLDDHR